jgi:GntR family transcriptional regulator/MocR family aminotransferase
LPADVDDREVARRAAMRGINVTALSSCYFGKTSKSGLVLGFGGVPEEAIVPALAMLARAIEDAGLGARCNGRDKVTSRR